MKKHLGVLCLFASAFAPFASAATVTVTITGNVYSGTDSNNNVFQVGTNLQNKSFLLTLTYDDSLGTATTSSCSGTPYFSQASGTDMTPKAQLSIPLSGNTFTIGGGDRGQTSGSWYALRYAAMGCSGYSSGARGYHISASYTGTYYGTNQIGWASGVSVLPASGSSFSSDFDWRKGLSSTDTNTSSSYTFPFSIDYIYGGTTYYAYGYLQPDSISIDGPPCAIPISETTNFVKWDDSNATWADFSMTVSPLSGAPSFFSGASIKEFAGAAGSDGCYASYAANNSGGPSNPYDPQTTISGGTWTVNSSGLASWDQLGWGTVLSGFYRSPTNGGNPASFPCGTTIYQIMKMQCSNGSWYSYGSTNSGNQNTLQINIQSSSLLKSTRAGVDSTTQSY